MKVLAEGYLRYDSQAVLARRILTEEQAEDWVSSNRHLWWEMTPLRSPWARFKAWLKIWFVR